MFMLSDKKDDNSPIQLRGQVEPKSHIIAIGGGKGGVGKSFISSSLAIFLAHMGYKTCAIDLDLGSANLHTSLGAGLPPKGVGDLILNPQMQLEDLVSPTPFPNLSIISGASDDLMMADIPIADRSKLMSSIFNLDTDFIILDLSAGTHQSTIDFFLMAQTKLVVMTPDPSSIENAYRFMKAAFHRRIKRFEFQLQIEELVADIMANKAKYSVRSPSDLIKAITEVDGPKGAKLQSLMTQMEFQIVLNQARSYKEAELGASVQSVCNKYFGVPCSVIGQIEHDNAVWQSQRKRRHLLIEYPYSRLYAQLMGMARRVAAFKSKNKDKDKGAPIFKAN
jgi:flagellar biosynthesis protein FlhG